MRVGRGLDTQACCTQGNNDPAVFVACCCRACTCWTCRQQHPWPSSLRLAAMTLQPTSARSSGAATRGAWWRLQGSPQASSCWSAGFKGAGIWVQGLGYLGAMRVLGQSRQAETLVMGGEGLWVGMAGFRQAAGGSSRLRGPCEGRGGWPSNHLGIFSRIGRQ